MEVVGEAERHDIPKKEREGEGSEEEDKELTTGILPDQRVIAQKPLN